MIFFHGEHREAIRAFQRSFHQFTESMEFIVAALDDLNAVVSGLKASASAAAAAFTSLETAVASGVPTASVEAAVTELKAVQSQIDTAVAAANAVLTPVAQAPAPAPQA